MHSAKGLEWPIVIPINSPTDLDEKMIFLHRRSDDTVHFRLLGEAEPQYELVKTEERDQQRRERIRLWYVALTRACDLLLLPRQSERSDSDWMSLIGARLEALPAFDSSTPSETPPPSSEKFENLQDQSVWSAEATTIAASGRTIVWRSPSRHEAPTDMPVVSTDDAVYTDSAEFGRSCPRTQSQARHVVPSKAGESAASCCTSLSKRY